MTKKVVKFRWRKVWILFL